MQVRKNILLAMAICMLIPCNVHAASYTEKLEDMLSIPSEEKVITIDGDVEVNGKSGSLKEELGVSSATEKKAISNEKYADELMEEYGYTKNDDGSYETEFAEKRLIVKGKIKEANSAYKNGYTVIQYDTPEEAALAYHEFTNDGNDVIIDQKISLEEFGDGSIMHLDKHKESTGNNVTVAVLDSGFDRTLLGDRCLEGVNAVDGSTDVTDEDYHGTAVSSIILSNTGSNIKVLPIKVMDADESTTITAINYALTYAAENADIINMSLGYVSDNANTLRFWNSAISNAVDNGIPVIVAAGNYGESTDLCYPACYEPCWTIGAVDEDKQITDFSNYGCIDFVSLGEEVDTIDGDGDSVELDGTSFSTPLISALAADLKAEDTDDIYSEIVNMCEDLGDEGYDEYYGYGLPVWHNYSVVTEATETSDGQEKCDWCDSVRTIPALAHDHVWDDGVIEKEATCTEDGSMIFTCTVCSETKTEVIQKTGHDYEVIGSQTVSCTEDGYTKYKCKNCGNVYSDITIQTGHSYTETDREEPTCTENGSITYVCQNCGDTKYEILECYGHNFVNGVCERCGSKENEEESHEHVYDDGVITKEATCTEDGVKTYTCSGCGDTYTESIPATGHSFTDWVLIQKGSCTVDTKERRICSLCGQEQTRTAVANGHKWVNETVTKEATCSSTGEKTYTCSACKTKKTESIPRKSHDLKSTVIKATLSKSGKKKVVCKTCGYTKTTEIIAPVTNIKLSSKKYTYNKKTPQLTVKDSNGNAVTSYVVTGWSTAVGKHTIKVRFYGNYDGVKLLKYTVLPKKAKITSTKIVKKTTVKLKWKNSKYVQIQYSKNKKSSKTITVKNASSKKIKLSSPKKYYVRIRSYKTVDGKKYYSSWSKWKKIRS